MQNCLIPGESGLSTIRERQHPFSCMILIFCEKTVDVMLGGNSDLGCNKSLLRETGSSSQNEMPTLTEQLY